MFTAIIKKERHLENDFERLMIKNPVIAYFILFLGMPIFTLLTVSLITAITVIPFAFIFNLI
ncbi:MAG: hypothetical protein RR229_02940 [Oscillospiraceae bacterium]